MRAMMDINEIRHRNVRTLVRRIEEAEGRSGDRAGGMTMLAAKLGKSSGQVAHFASDKPIKRIGDQIAREIEAAMGLERGWMDWLQDECESAPDGRSQTVRLDPDIVESVALALQDTVAELRVVPPITALIDVFARTYDRIGTSGVTTADVVWMVRQLEQGEVRDAKASNISDGSRDAAGRVGRGNRKT
jgi:hypothetical protein